MIMRFIFHFSVSLSVSGYLAPSYAYDLMLICPLKPFLSPRLHWCGGYCHSLLLKGRVSGASRLELPQQDDFFPGSAVGLWNEEDTLRLVKRLLFFFFLFFDWHQPGEASITQRKSKLPVSFWITILFPSRISIFYGLHLPTEIRLPFAPIPPLKFMLWWHLVLGGHDSFPVCMALHSYFWSANVLDRQIACNFQ